MSGNDSSCAPVAVEYRPIPGFTGYRAGDDGTIWTEWEQSGTVDGRGTEWFRSGNWKLKHPTSDDRGRLRVELRRDDGKLQKQFVHRLVLISFVGPCPPGMEACHDPDRNSSNCALSNLRWDTKLGNHEDRRRHGTIPSGENHKRAKLSFQQVEEIQRRALAGEHQRALAAEFGISQSHVGRIHRKESWVNG